MGVTRLCCLRYISRALTLRRTLDHWRSSRTAFFSRAVGARAKYFTSRMREVLSARSRKRPRAAKCQPSLRGERGAGDAFEEVARLTEFLEELHEAAGEAAVERLFHHAVVEGVELFPHFRRDRFADAAGVFAGPLQAGDDRAGIARIEGQELDDVVLRGAS